MGFISVSHLRWIITNLFFLPFLVKANQGTKHLRTHFSQIHLVCSAILESNAR